MKTDSTFYKYIRPIIVLVVICLAISAALAATYGLTEPIITQRAIDEANAAKQQLLPDADKFTNYDGKLLATDDGKVKIIEAAVKKIVPIKTVVIKAFFTLEYCLAP